MDNILLLLAHERVWEKNEFFNSLFMLDNQIYTLYNRKKMENCFIETP